MFRIASKAEIELDQQQAFAAFTDPAYLRGKAQKTGIDIQQIKGSGISQGAAWQLEGMFAKRRRSVMVTVAELSEPHLLRLKFQTKGIEGRCKLMFREKDAQLTRVRLVVDMTATTISAKLLLQGAKLTKHRQRRRLGRALRAACRAIERSASNG